MKNALLCLAFVALFSAVAGKSDYFSDVSENEYAKLREIARYLQQRVEEAEVAEEAPEPDARSLSSKYELNPPFEYAIPEVNTRNGEADPFAVGPADPRFYQEFGSSVEISSDAEEDKKEKRPSVDVVENVKVLGSEASTVGHGPSEAVRKVPVSGINDQDGKADIYFTAIVAGCSAAAVIAVIGIGIGCYRLQKNAKAAADVDYPAYGVTGPNKDISPTSGDRRLAQSAQMYHYQHQKQQIIAMENSVGSKDRRSSISDPESEEENEEGDYTVYECPGLASTGEMEVKNPLFQDDQTPATNPANDATEESQELPNLISFE